ncbi:PAS domain-containing protein [Paraflavisolibacter sp. H34]|uniref:PAS domain-containing sensor histidine kinase n=1 Tax=Huijunlia imazamoxiresistens TaxID=3127457 RepID=UPI00301AA16A
MYDTQETEKFYNLLMQAPVGMYLLKGPDYVIEMANEPILKLWGKGPQVVGKPVLESFPEVAEQGYIDLLDRVRITGEPFQSDEIPVWYDRDGRRDQLYVTLLYQPFYEEGEVTGIFSIATDVTERVTARRKLAESEQNLRSTILQAPVAMCIVRGPSFVVEVANKKMYEIWGKGAEEVLHRPVFKALPEIRHQGLEEILQKVVATGETFTAWERPVSVPRGGTMETVYLNFVYEPFREGDGSVSGVIAVAVDVTEQIKARRQVESSEQRVRFLIQNAPYPIAVYAGPEMRIEMANSCIMDIWGKGTEVIGKRYAEVLPEMQYQGVLEQLERVYTTGIPFHARNQRLDLVVDDKPRTFYFHYSFTPLYEDGQITGVMNTGVDITDLHTARQRVEQSEQNLRNLVLQAPVAMCILMGADHIVDIANDAMIELWGKPVEAVMHKPIFEGLPDAREQGLEKLLEQVYRTGEPFQAYERPVALVRKGKAETVYQNFVYEPHKDSEGNVLGVLVISIDVTAQVLARQKIEEVVVLRTRELARANEALQKSNAELKRSNQNLEDFASAASHDMKEPIRKIHFFADRLKGELFETLTDSQKRLFERLEGASKRMGTLVDDLLSYSQVSKGVVEEVEINLNKKVETVLEDLELEVEQKAAVLQVGRLPTIKGNRRQFLQLFQNLISNALKYSAPGTRPKITITSRVVRAGEVKPDLFAEGESAFHLIEVKDNGIGFDPKDAERIFQVFTRLHSNAEYRGTGVGLSIVQKVVENHRGYIWAESAPGSGATFKILLPV